MASNKSQYHHYIPRFILKQFSHGKVEIKRGVFDDVVNVCELPSEQFRARQVGKCCGSQDLYYDSNTIDPMRIEHLFSKLESRTSMVFSKIRDAVLKNLEHIDILEKDVQTLFSFMSISPIRSQQYIDSIKDVRRENDFLWKELEDEYPKGGRRGDTREVWLAQLLYHLEHSHEEMLADAAKSKENVTAGTYKRFVETFALQIWKAADGYEFFLNDRLVDFEGDTEYGLGMRTKETGPELIWMTKEDLIHLVLPISPEVAVIFCDESRCWESPFADMMHRAKIPFSANSLLAKAPHKEIVDVHVPERKRSRKIWPATTAWRVSIGTLSREQHSIIASYSLSHAQAVVVVRNREKFEKAKKELEIFAEEQAKRWKTQGFSFTDPAHLLPMDISNPSRQIIEKVVDEHEAAFAKIMALIAEGKPLRRTKENIYISWLAIRTVGFTSPHASTESANTAVKTAFEAAYPPQHSQHRKLLTVNFMAFYNHGIDEETFSQLSFAIDTKSREVQSSSSFREHWEASRVNVENPPMEPLAGNSELLQNPAFQSVMRAACGFEILSWMFEERQDILATFIKDLAIPVHESRPEIIRIRGRCM
ncbi:hypothetical protein HBI56_194990 [Parastagonospora nodorum]|uniref:DUF4238 domain-containing protein n=1 Tax=Phaeosphaeria nodorum (strain SN15 / ATCC MYA-4574 / FGSC 10173) TaxID=321614 RepID=A0A7U2EZC4_PHANO|nr:hypothetical protein HBH56_206670 [Parastagonospora nodorum]QRC94683.1 hypothetical protein JI435_148460 [Parastagonospora nodorum SN15]KAH3923703.1 hypothetical protein HBH54_205540 [Parastagonospora nodorum]KAH3942261.1 hypothetical protein HBH53_188830 [Parastagonospora nodorum]KAH3967117.1 hypothetical protein HBH52_190890 [Parastagonospora nodorum]